MRRHTRWMRRTALLACLVGLAVIGGGYLAIGAAGDEKGSPDLTGKKSEPRSESKLPPLPKKLRARVVQPQAGDAGSGAAEPAEDDPGLDEPGPKPTSPASTGGRKPTGVLSEVHAQHHDRDRALQRRRPAAARGARGRAPDHRGRQLDRAHPLQVGRRPRQVDRHGLRLLRLGVVRARLRRPASAPLASGPLMSWGEAGQGKWVTIYANHGHVYLVVAGVRFDTSGPRETGSRWTNTMRSNAGFVARHPPGL